MHEVKYPMPKCNVIKPQQNKKVRVIRDFTFMDKDYSIGDILEIGKSTYGNFDLVFDWENVICEVDTDFFNNRFEYVDKIQLSSDSEQLNNNKINYNNTKIDTVLREYLIREIMRLDGVFYIHQAEKIADTYIEKLNYTNEIIVRKGTTFCANEILEALSFEKKSVRKEFGIEEVINND